MTAQLIDLMRDSAPSLIHKCPYEVIVRDQLLGYHFNLDFANMLRVGADFIVALTFSLHFKVNSVTTD